jgi:carboxymethylenebutenolidase
MTFTDPNHLEYATETGYIHVIMDNGKSIPAYWAHPKLGGKFPAVALLHDWWGLTGITRYLAHKFAQIGYYVIAPDLFDGQLATTPQRAMQLLTALGDKEAKMRVHSAVDVVERHHQCNRSTAVVGVGMGGGLAFDMAISRDDVEAIITFSAFPQAYFGRFKDVKAPILAFYGSNETLINRAYIDQFRSELATTPLSDKHRVELIDGLGHDFFDEDFTDEEQDLSRVVVHRTMDFLQSCLKGPQKPPPRPVM